MNTTFYFLLLIVGTFIATILVLANDSNDNSDELQDVLRRFSTKLLLTFDPPIEFRDEQPHLSHHQDATYLWDWLHRLEIEEIYDQQRGLAKIIIVNLAKAERAELFYRAEDDLYLETVYDLKQNTTSATKQGLQVKRCTATIGHGEESKSKMITPKYYFRLLKKLTQGFDGTKWPGSVLIGPSVFLHSAQAELLARYRKRSAEIFDTTNQSSDRMKRVKLATTTTEMRHKFLVEQDAAIVRESTNGTQVTVVKFSQTNYILADRSPLLTQLAAVVSYSFDDSNLYRDGALRYKESICANYTIDYLDIDNATISHLDETNRDLFKQSRLRACFKDEPPAERFGFDSTWSRFFQLRSTRFSTNLRADNIDDDPRGIHVAVDMEQHLMRFDIENQSKNVIDLQHEFIYHMPNEPFASSMSELELDQADINGTKTKNTNKVRNTHCTIISSESFPGMKILRQAEMALLSSPNSANRWAHLIGKPNSIIYLGVDSSFGQKAHEFEFSYKDEDSLSPLSALLFDPQVWSRFEPNTGSNLIVGKLWIRADESSCSQAINAHRPLGCVNPTPIKLRIDLVQPPEYGVREQEILFASKQIYFTEFEWELFDEDDVGILDKVYETFDRRLCPIEKLQLQMEVEWKEEIQEENFETNEEFCQNRGQLDDLMFGQLTRYLQDYATFDVELMDLKLKQALPGTMMAQYSIILSELPDLANSFQRDFSMTALIDLKKELLATFEQVKTLFECLSWASQFGNSTAVSYSTKIGCSIYGTKDSVSKQKLNDDEFVVVYKRDLRSSQESIRNSVSGLKLFKTEHIDAINHEIVHSNRDDNGFEACLSRSTGQSLVRDIKFGKLRLLPPFTNHMQNQRRIPVKLGFKFVEIFNNESFVQKMNDSGQISVKTRQHFEVISFSDCMRRCNELVECTSFSFCENIESQHQYCQLSDIKLSSKIKLTAAASSSETIMNDNQLIQRQSGCQLHSKDYLLFFEEARNAAELAGGSTVKLTGWSQLNDGDGSELECARLCHQKELECMRFIHCGSNICYGHQSGSPNSSLRIYQPNECTLYKKKSLELYRRLLSTDHGPFNWSLSERKHSEGNSDNESLRIEEIPGLVSEERCAKLCTENVECQSFDSCSTPIYTFTTNKVEQTQTSSTPLLQPNDLTFISLKRNMPHFMCTLLSRSLGSGLIFNQATNNKTTTTSASDVASLSNSVESSRHCSHFERQGLKQASDFIIELLISEQTNSKHRIGPSADSKATGLFIAAVLGLLLGVAGNILVSFVLVSFKKRPLFQTDSK